MSTYSARPIDVKPEWLLVDAKCNLSIGRLASQIASRLRGKHKPLFTPHIDMGDFIVVINAEHVASTGSKEDTKIYYTHTQYPGGIKQETLKERRKTDPTRIIEDAVKRMLPKGPLGRKIFAKLKVYAGENHPHTAQQPTLISFVTEKKSSVK